jgi:hypothetical protein
VVFGMTESVDPFLGGGNRIRTGTSVIISQATFRYSQTRSTELKEGVSTTAAHAPHSLWSEGRTPRQAHHNLLLTPVHVSALKTTYQKPRSGTGASGYQLLQFHVFNAIRRIGRSHGPMASVTAKLWASLGHDTKALFNAEVWLG